MRFLVFIILVSITLSASYIRWYGDYEDAHRESLKQNKQLLVLLIEKNSIKAKNLIKNSFMNQSYIDKLNEKFISVIVTKGQKGSYPIELLYTLEYPALFFLDKHELFLCDPIEGDITPKQLSKHLENCL